jgi:hypothetical protein
MKRFSRMPAPLYSTYYHNQIGSGISEVFRGREHQRGHGIGSIFTGLFRLAKPLLMKGARAVGKQALSTGVQILDDIAQGENVKQSMKLRIADGGKSIAAAAKKKLEDFQQGRGYKRKFMERSTISVGKVNKRTTSQKGSGRRKQRVKRGKLAASFRAAINNRVPKRKKIIKLNYKDIF